MNRRLFPALAMLFAACADTLDDPSDALLDDRSDGGALGFGEGELGVQSAALTLDPDLVDLDAEDVFDALHPHKLRIHTCDAAEAFTTDPLSATIQFGGKSNTFVLKDSDPNKIDDWDEFPVYVDHLPKNMENLQSLLIQKRGNNAWCIDEVELYQRERLRFRFRASDPRSGTYVTPRPAGDVWLDGEGDPAAPTNSILFSELKIGKGIATHQRPTVLEIDTCTTAAHPTPGTDDPVSLTWVHDGITEVVELNNPGNDREPGNTDKYLLDEHGVRALQSLRLNKSGNDLWCISAMRLVVGSVTVATRNADSMLDGDVTGITNQLGWTLDKVVGGTVTTTAAFVGLPLKRAPLWRPVYPAYLALSGLEFHGCQPNFTMRFFATNTGELPSDEDVTGTLSGDGTYWAVMCYGNGHCEVPPLEPFESYRGSTTVSKRVQLAPGAQATITLDARLSMPTYMRDVMVTARARSESGVVEIQATKPWERMVPDDVDLRTIDNLDPATCLN